MYICSQSTYHWKLHLEQRLLYFVTRTDLKIVHYSDMCGGSLVQGVVDHVVPLCSRDPAGQEHLIVLVHTEWLSTQILHWQCFTNQKGKMLHLTGPSELYTLMNLTNTSHGYLNRGLNDLWLHRKNKKCVTHLSTMLLKSKTPQINFAAYLWRRNTFTFLQ